MAETSSSSPAPFGEEPSIYKVLVYNQITPEEIAKANIDVKKVSFWDITASLPGNSAVDDPHVSIFWYGPKVSSEKGLVVHMRGHKLESKYTESILAAVTPKIGGTPATKDNETTFKDFTMKINYASIADLARAVQSTGNMKCECTVEYEMVTREERAASTLPKTKVLGEKALEK